LATQVNDVEFFGDCRIEDRREKRQAYSDNTKDHSSAHLANSLIDWGSASLFGRCSEQTTVDEVNA
jgi:hypothetical protein